MTPIGAISHHTKKRVLIVAFGSGIVILRPEGWFERWSLDDVEVVKFFDSAEFAWEWLRDD
jgi:hypothetical protein